MRTSRHFHSVLCLLVAFAVCAPAADAATYTVTTTADGGAGSLRQVIVDLNATPGEHAVHFAMPGDGPHVIAPLTPLPAFARVVTIDGYTQPGAS